MRIVCRGDEDWLGFPIVQPAVEKALEALVPEMEEAAYTGLIHGWQTNCEWSDLPAHLLPAHLTWLVDWLIDWLID